MHLTAATARHLMAADPLTVPDSLTADQATAALTDRGAGAAVVADPDGRPVGVVTKTDLLVHAREKVSAADPTPVRAVMTEAVFTVAAHAPAREVVEKLVTLSVAHLFVVDADGRIVGEITPLGVLRKLA